MHFLLLWLKANWPDIALALGIWSAGASLLNRTAWPKPAEGAAKWKTGLHAVLVDWPAFMASLDYKGIFGLPVNVPFVTLSKAPDDPSKLRVGGLLPILFVLALGGMVSGCAWARCELNHLPQTAQSVIAAVVAIASQSSNYVEDLIALGKDVGPSQVECIATALVDSSTAPKGYKGDQPAGVPIMRGHLEEYLAVRKAQGAKLECAPAKTAYRLSPLSWPKDWGPVKAVIELSPVRSGLVRAQVDVGYVNAVPIRVDVR